LTVGENGFGALGSSLGAFSVGDAGAAGEVVVVIVVVVVVVVVVDVSGACSSSFAHDAVSMPTATIALSPATAGKR
jgi:hypothetical protein